MAKTIKEQIAEKVELAIKDVKITNGYQMDIPDAQIERGKTTPVDYRKVPAVFIYEGDEEIIEREYCSTPRIKSRFSVDLEMWTKDETGSLPEKINLMEGEITKAIFEDDSFGGLAEMAEKTGSIAFFIEGEKVLGGRIISFDIYYLCQEKNPYLQ